MTPLIGTPPHSDQPHCWTRFRFHAWSYPYKKAKDKITIYRVCLVCGWRKMIGVE